MYDSTWPNWRFYSSTSFTNVSDGNATIKTAVTKKYIFGTDYNYNRSLVKLQYGDIEGTVLKWKNLDFSLLLDQKGPIVNTDWKRIYALGYNHIQASVVIFLWSVDFDGNLINRYVLSDSQQFVYDGYGIYQMLLSNDQQNLYITAEGDSSTFYLIHLEINGDEITSKTTLTITDAVNGGDLTSISIAEDNQLFLQISQSQGEWIKYLVYDGNLNSLWSQQYTNFVWVAGATYATFGPGTGNFLYVLDKFYDNPSEWSSVNNQNAGYYKISVYGPVDKDSIIYEWKFWLSIVTTVLSLICFIGLQIYERNSILKRGISRVGMNYQRMSDSDNNNSDMIIVNIKRSKILLRCIGLIILAILITIIHFEKIDTINSFLDQIGSYDNVRQNYLTNSKSTAITNGTYTYDDLCYCTDSALDINSAQCNAGNCYKNTYVCGDIVQYLGQCDLTWYKSQCECTFLVDGCNTTIDHDTTIPATLPDNLYNDCYNAYTLLSDLLWSIYGIHIGFSSLYIISAIVTKGKISRIGWITRVSSIVTLGLLITVSVVLTDNICTGSDKLLGYEYPGCGYVYPKEFDSTFEQLEGDTYNDIVSVVVLYGMKTALKFVHVWIPFSCTTHNCCLD